MRFKTEKFFDRSEVHLTVSFDFVTALKQAVQAECSAKLHFHDGCGGQYFTLEEPTDKVCAFVLAYLEREGISAVFSEDRTQFVLTEKTAEK